MHCENPMYKIPPQTVLLLLFLLPYISLRVTHQPPSKETRTQSHHQFIISIGIFWGYIFRVFFYIWGMSAGIYDVYLGNIWGMYLCG